MSFETGRVIERIIVAGCIPILLIIGYKLFLLGVTGAMQITVGMSSYTAKVTSVAPGGLCFILAISLGAYSLFSRVQYASSSLTKSTTTMTSTQSLSAPQNTGELNAADTGKPDQVQPSPALTKQKVSLSPAPLSVTTKVVKQQVNMSYMTGPGSNVADVPLSYRLRVAIDDLYFCDRASGKTDDDACRSAFYKQFTRIPQPQDLEEIEKTERDMRSSVVELQKQADSDHQKQLRSWERR